MIYSIFSALIGFLIACWCAPEIQSIGTKIFFGLIMFTIFLCFFAFLYLLTVLLYLSSFLPPFLFRLLSNSTKTKKSFSITALFSLKKSRGLTETLYSQKPVMILLRALLKAVLSRRTKAKSISAVQRWIKFSRANTPPCLFS